MTMTPLKRGIARGDACADNGGVRAALTPTAPAVAAALAAVLLAGPAAAQPARLPVEIWGIDLPADAVVDVRTLTTLKRSGVNAIVVESAAFSTRRVAAIRAEAAKANGIIVIVASPTAGGALTAPAVAARRAR